MVVHNMKIICTLHCRAVVFFPASKIMLYKYVANMHNIYHTEIFTLNQCTSKQKLTYTLFSSNQLVYVLSSLVYPINFQLNTTAIIGITYIYSRQIYLVYSKHYILVVCMWRVLYFWYKECNQWYRQEQNYVRNKFSRLEVVLLCLRNITQCHEALCVVMGFSSFFWL